MTGFVTIRPVRRDDADALIAAHRDSRAHHAPWVTPFTDKAGFATWFSRMQAPNAAPLIAQDPGSDGIVGLFALTQIVHDTFCSAYLGYHGMAAFAGRGLMTEALRRVVRHAFEAGGLHRIEANIQPGNVRSIALVRRCQFQLEGYSPRFLRINGAWRDHERWAVLAD